MHQGAEKYQVNEGRYGEKSGSAHPRPGVHRCTGGRQALVKGNHRPETVLALDHNVKLVNHR